MNMRDNGLPVIVGQRKGKTYDKAVADGWVPGETLFEIEEALEKGTIICYLLSDAAQIELWPTVKKYLTPGKSLYFSHGFGITYKEKTGIVPPADVDVFLAAPKGSGTSLRRLFVEGKGLNSSFAVYQDATGKAREKCIAMAIGVGSGYLFETDFYKEVSSDLTGERGTLMGAIQGIFAAQYEVLRANGHSPSEAFNERRREGGGPRRAAGLARQPVGRGESAVPGAAVGARRGAAGQGPGRPAGAAAAGDLPVDALHRELVGRALQRTRARGGAQQVAGPASRRRCRPPRRRALSRRPLR